jgi:NAD(P)-dependent dehydrogenase (short-subunit alcohol dehydrogenase family)
MSASDQPPDEPPPPVSPSIRLDGRVAIVTGAGNGLGRAYALYLAGRGARVLVNNRRHASDAPGQTSAERTVAAIQAAGGIAAANFEDVRDPRSGERMVAQALDTWGRLDALVNNAGVDQHAPLHRITVEQFLDVFEPNFHGTLYATHAAYASMRRAGHGRIVMSTSSAGLHGLHGLTAYAASKGALIALARSLAQEGRSRDVRTNVIAPYATTKMTAAHTPPDVAAQLRPELVAPMVAYLASAECALNGSTIVAGKGGFRRATSAEGEMLAFDSAAAITPEALAAEAARFAAGGAEFREFADALAAFEDFYRTVPGVLPCSPT